MTMRLIPGLLASLLLASAGLAQSAADQMDHTIQPYVQKKQFTGAVLVAQGGEILFSKGYGFADIEKRILNTPSTKFHIGSLTKQFTAAAILVLEERGKLKVEDPVRKYLPDAPAAWNEITIFELLTHTAGITDNRDRTIAGPFKTTADNVARFRDKPLDFQPGKKWKYSNDGYILLGYLIETVSGQSYESFLSENIFKPLGMENSGYDSDSVIPGSAVGYVSDHHNELVKAKSPFHMSVVQAAGALYSTSGDLLRWERGLFGGKLLSAASLQKMTTAFTNDYGFGLAIEFNKGHKVISHNGLINGFRATLTYYPDDQLTLAVLGNLEEASVESIAGKLAVLARREKP